MKTAIQELFSKLEIEHPNLFNTNTLEGREFINSYYKFFELEKQQIINAIVWFDDTDRTPSQIEISAKQYYNETFKK
jgi:hypothetical protein